MHMHLRTRPASKAPRTVATAVAVVMGFALASAAAAQQPASMPWVNGPTVEHVHRGELGDKWLVVEEAVRCNCSCNEDVHHCQFRMECSTSPAWSARMYKSLQAGQTPDEIKASFVADFGPSILMEPPMEGFNLLAWFLPGVTIVMAGALVGLIARGGMGKGNLAPVRELGAEDAERLREAMRKLDEAESPDW